MNMPKYQIRTATIEDLDEIAHIEAVCFCESEAATRESIRERLTIFPNHFWLLTLEGKIISFVNGCVTDQENLTDEMYENASLHQKQGAWQMIFGVDTLPDYRNHGYASVLLQHVIEETRKDGKKGLVLTCKERLIHFYESFGFVNEGVSESGHGGVTWYAMRLTIKDLK